LLIGRNFGVITDIETGPNGNLFVVSLSQGAVYEIFRVGGGDGGGDVRTFTTELTGAAEVPGPGDPDGSGTATISVDPSQGEVCFELTVSNIELPAAAAHIHVAPVDEAGPVVVPLDPAPDASGSSSGCVSDVDRALIQNIIQNPEQYYVNVHNAEFPDGAVRGQLSDSDGGGGEVHTFSTDMSGAEEVPGPGDPDGTGTATITLDPSQGEVCFELTVSNIEPATAAHIHVAPVGEAGPVVVPLEPPTDGSSSGCVSDVDRALIQNIIQNPDQYYVNVHNEEFPDGAVRGQLRGEDDDGNGDDSEVEFEATLTGDQEVPPVETDMRGDAEIEFENNRLEFELRIRNNMNDIFAAHIHCAPPGENGPIGVTLFMGSFTDERGLLARGTIESADAENECGWTDVDDIIAAMESGNAYVNVHTTEESGGVPSGEIRGNLIPDDNGEDDD
jgi:hypothetical protein